MTIGIAIEASSAEELKNAIVTEIEQRLALLDGQRSSARGSTVKSTYTGGIRELAALRDFLRQVEIRSRPEPLVVAENRRMIAALEKIAAAFPGSTVEDLTEMARSAIPQRHKYPFVVANVKHT